MNEKSLRSLEIRKIKDMLAAECVTPPGKEAAQALCAGTDEDEVRAMLIQTGEAYAYITRFGASAVIGHPEIRPVLARVKLDAQLSMRELLDMASFLRAVHAARRHLCENEEAEETSLFALAALLSPAPGEQSAIERSVISDSEMADDASARLQSLRKQIRRQSDAVKEKLQALVHHLDQQGVLQENVITMRNGRYVLPVIAANKKSVPGIVHDQSATGATLFIEPMAVVEINNAIRQLQLDEKAEIERILEELSHRLHLLSPILESNAEILTQLDLVFAKARLAEQYDGVCPDINDKGIVEIHEGRHPLLNRETVVPISVWLGKSFTVLLITGPNTGGKTVTLKTIGLFALMAQSGLFLPAGAGTQMPVFDEIFADIGDEQSIEQNLSTFSSHMKQISEIMRSLTPRSLVLLDELGAGTDPTEGAALAMSILEELRRRRVRTVVTSHYAELKAYSLSHAGTENASMEFDASSLKPTYRLLVGVPGNSHAFLISSKLGLERFLIDRARSYVDTDARKLDKVLAGAEEYRVSAQAQRTEAEALRRTLEKEKRELEKERTSLQREKEQAVRKAVREAEKIREEARREADEVIEELKKLDRANDPSAIFKARDLRRKLADKAPQEDAEAPRTEGEAITNYLPGMSVFVEGLQKEGVLLTRPNSKGKVSVRLGIMQTEVDASALRAVKEKKNENTGSEHVHKTVAAVPLSLDVRGQLAEEAVMNVDRYLDLALGRRMQSVTIIHGKGTGVLRGAVSDYLKTNKHVKSFRMGAYGEGDAGVTVVELKL